MRLKTKLLEAILRGHNVNTPVKEQFTKSWIRAINFATDYPAEYKYIEMFSHSPKISDEAENKINKLILPVVEIYEKGKNEGIIKQIDSTSLIYFTSGGITGSVLNKPKITKEEIEVLISMAWDAIKN